MGPHTTLVPPQPHTVPSVTAWSSPGGSTHPARPFTARPCRPVCLTPSLCGVQVLQLSPPSGVSGTPRRGSEQDANEHRSEEGPSRARTTDPHQGWWLSSGPRTSLFFSDRRTEAEKGCALLRPQGEPPQGRLEPSSCPQGIAWRRVWTMDTGAPGPAPGLCGLGSHSSSWSPVFPSLEQGHGSRLTGGGEVSTG